MVVVISWLLFCAKRMQGIQYEEETMPHNSMLLYLMPLVFIHPAY